MNITLARIRNGFLQMRSSAIHETSVDNSLVERAIAKKHTPTSGVSDHSNYLQQSPFQLSPGICLSSAYLALGGLQINQGRTTTSGVLLETALNEE